MTEDTPTHTRRLRSFVIRSGRMTSGQQAAYDELWPRYGLSPDVPLTTGDEEVKKRELILEIGFGMGQSLAAMAAAAPEARFVGIEVHPPGIGSMCLQIQSLGLENVRLYQHDAVEVLERCIGDSSLDRVQLYFPDPWHKRRHHKRRLVQPDFVSKIAGKLVNGGLFHLATDWEPYASHMLKVLEAEPALFNTAGDGFAARPEWRPETKFEKRGKRLGHGVYDLLYSRV
jgi:tRNA (guanine-N7-)-methyltransferase